MDLGPAVHRNQNKFVTLQHLETVGVSPLRLCQHKTPEETGDICCGLPFWRALVFGNEWALCVRSKSLSLALWPATKSDGTFQKEACATFSFLDLSKNRCCCEKNKQSWVWHWEPIVTLLRATTLNTPQTAINDGQCNTECCALIYKAKQTSHREEYWQLEQSVTSLFIEVNRNNHSKSSWKALIRSLPGEICKISGLKSHKLQL